MSIPLPKLDDRDFAQLVDELRALIPRYAPDWTDHNVSDPGVMLLELFAWVTETFFYRADRAHLAGRARILALLGAEFTPVRPTRVRLTVTASGLTQESGLEAGALLTATPRDGEAPLSFQTVQDLVLKPDQSGRYGGTAEAWQMAPVGKDGSELLGYSDGHPFQAFVFSQPFVVLGTEPITPIVPRLQVDGQVWEHRTSLMDSEPADRHFTFDPSLGAARFGNGALKLARDVDDKGDADGEDKGMGRIPPSGAKITASYHSSMGQAGWISETARFAFVTPPAFGIDVIQFEILSQGVDPIDLDSARQQAAERLSSRHRAVTSQDFERLVLEEFQQQIARVKCLPGMNLELNEPEAQGVEDHVSVVIVPEVSDGDTGHLEPSAQQQQDVFEFLDQRRLITCRHHVVGPQYTAVRLYVEVAFVSRYLQDVVYQAISAKVTEFFDPLTGGPGPDAQGWPFGRDVYASELYQLIEDVEGVDHVERLILKRLRDETQWVDAGEQIEVPERNLVVFKWDQDSSLVLLEQLNA